MIAMFGSPISGHLDTQSVPSKSTAITFAYTVFPCLLVGNVGSIGIVCTFSLNQQQTSDPLSSVLTALPRSCILTADSGNRDCVPAALPADAFSTTPESFRLPAKEQFALLSSKCSACRSGTCFPRRFWYNNSGRTIGGLMIGAVNCGIKQLRGGLPNGDLSPLRFGRSRWSGMVRQGLSRRSSTSRRLGRGLGLLHQRRCERALFYCLRFPAHGSMTGSAGSIPVPVPSGSVLPSRCPKVSGLKAPAAPSPRAVFPRRSPFGGFPR